MESLPNELMNELFGFFDVQTLKTASTVSKHWNDIANTSTESRKIWRLKLGEEQPEIYGTPRNATCEDDLFPNQKKRHLKLQKEKYEMIMQSERKFEEIFIEFSNSPSFNVSSPQIHKILEKNRQTLNKFTLYTTNGAPLRFLPALTLCDNLSEVSIDHLDSINDEHALVLVKTLLRLKALKSLDLGTLKIPTNELSSIDSSDTIEKFAISGVFSHQIPWSVLCSKLPALIELSINHETGRYRGDIQDLFSQLNFSCPQLKSLKLSFPGTLPKTKLCNLSELTVMMHDYNLSISEFLSMNPSIETVKFSRHYDGHVMKIIEETMRSSRVTHIHCISGLMPPTQFMLDVASKPRPHLLNFTYATCKKRLYAKTFSRIELDKIQNLSIEWDKIAEKLNKLVHDK